MSQITTSTSSKLSLDWQKEFSVQEEGKVTGSRKGAARLSGVSRQAIQQLLKEVKEGGASKSLSEPLQPFTGQDFDGGNLPDVLLSAIVAHYAFKGIKEAQQTLLAMSAIGLRSYVHQKLGYKPNPKRKLTAEEIIELCCLPVPTSWQKRFPEEYYEHLSRLTGLIVQGAERPGLWAALTKELVYDYLPTGIYTEIKRCKEELGGWEKLHQYLSSDGVEILEAHQKKVLHHMQGAASLEQLRTALKQACSGQYQLVLL